MEERLRTIYQGAQPTTQTTDNWVEEYDTLLKEIHPESPPARTLFCFMFDSPDVPVEVTAESETLLTKVMGDNRTWAWTEVDLPMIRTGQGGQSLMGAIGIDFDNPRDFSVVRLDEVHNKWVGTKQERHPLIPILECWHMNYGATKK